MIKSNCKQKKAAIRVLEAMESALTDLGMDTIQPVKARYGGRGLSI